MSDFDALKHQIEVLAPWFHNIHLPGGLETAPDHPLGDFPSYKWEVVSQYLPLEMSGYEVLDIGCNAGFYSLELAKRNARVTAIDVDRHYLKQAEFVAGLFGLEDKISFRQMQVYDLAGMDRHFDVVLFMGVFYHLRYPMLALDIIASKVKRLMILQSLSLEIEEEIEPIDDFSIEERSLMLEKGWPVMAFVENCLSGDPTNWWVPNSAAIKAMSRSSGLQFVHSPGHEIYFFEPDPDRETIEKGWNRSEYFSATGKEWIDEEKDKTGKPGSAATPGEPI